MCDTPAGARPSGSNSSSAKLLVPSGGLAQASGGDTFSPTQFGERCLSLHAFLTASSPLSLSADEVSVSTPAAWADPPENIANAKQPAVTTRVAALIIASSLLAVFDAGLRPACRQDAGGPIAFRSAGFQPALYSAAIAPAWNGAG